MPESKHLFFCGCLPWQLAFYNFPNLKSLSPAPDVKQVTRMPQMTTRAVMLELSVKSTELKLSKNYQLLIRSAKYNSWEHVSRLPHQYGCSQFGGSMSLAGSSFVNGIEGTSASLHLWAPILHTALHISPEVPVHGILHPLLICPVYICPGFAIMIHMCK